jgi:hypothetical protein
MKQIRFRVTADGKETKHLYHDGLKPVDDAIGEYYITRATEVYFDNLERKWKIEVLETKEVLDEAFDNREDALKFEQEYLQAKMVEEANRSGS